MFFNFFKRSKARNVDKNEKQCSNEKQTLPGAGAVAASECVARKKEKIPKGTQRQTSDCEKTNHCANSLVSALHLKLSHDTTDDDGEKNIREIHHGGGVQSVSHHNRTLGEVKNNKNSNKGDDEKNDSISKGSVSTETTSVDDSARYLSEPVSKFSPKLFALRRKQGENDSKSVTGNFFNDFIMGKGRNRHRGPRSNPVQNISPQQQAKNAQKNKQQQQAHGSKTNKNENLPQKIDLEKRKNNDQGNDNKKEEIAQQEILVVQERDVVKNNNAETGDTKILAGDANGDVAVAEAIHTTTENNASSCASFIHAQPANEQQQLMGGSGSNLLTREFSNEFAPPEKKSKTCETTVLVHQSDEELVKKTNVNLGENQQQLSSETDEMGQPNSKNGVNNHSNNNNESSANFNSTTSGVAAPNTITEEKNLDMGSDASLQRATSPNPSAKSVRFNDENLCSYADDIFYEASGSTTSLDNLLPNNFNNSNEEVSDKKVPLVADDDFDIINDDDDDDEIPSTYEEAQSISVLVTNEEFYENIVQPPSKNNVQINNHEENSHDSAFNDDDDVVSADNDKNNAKNHEENEKLSIYSENDDEIEIKSMTDLSEKIHSLQKNDDEVLNNNNKNLYMEDTISLPDIVESSHHHGVSENFDEKSDNNEKRDLVNQESRYNVQLEAAAQKVNELKTQIQDLERDISNKAGVQERLQAELEAANKDSETVRSKLKQQAEELERLRLESDDQTEEWRQKYYDLEKSHMETEDKLKSAQTLATTLQIQIADVRSDTEKCQLEKEKLMDEKTEEQKVLREALDKAIKEKAEIETKWKHDFEQLRNVNTDREERLMEDCEWKMRSMQKQCKEKLDTKEKERAAAVQKMMKIEEDCKRHTIELQNVKSYELELSQLRNLTNGQHETISQYRQQIDELKVEVATITKKLEEQIENCKDIKKKFELQIIEKEKDAINRIDIARGTIAMQWEDKLLEEMARLKMELEQIGLEEKQESLAKLRKETDEELQALTSTFTAKQEELEQEIANLKEMLDKKQGEYVDLQAKSDSTMMETRQYLDRAERDSQLTMQKEIKKREGIIETMKEEHEKKVEQMEQKWNARLERLQEEYQRDISDQTELLKSKHKREIEEQWRQMVAEKEEALQGIESKHRKRIEEAENHIRELEMRSDNVMTELEEAHTSERSALEKRDAKNVQEIDTLHKKCRCLTKLFEEMRMRYERRDPRPEDLRQITELKSIVEAQDRDLRILTERFREIQIFQQHQQNMLHSHSLPPYAQVVAQQQAAQQAQQSGQPPQMIPPIRSKSKSRTPVKQMPNGTQLPPPPPPPPISSAMMQMFNSAQAHNGSPVCEVIYEENEENDQMNGYHMHKERTPARMMNGDSHMPPPVDQKAIVNDIINEVVASAHIQAHGLAESAF